jgi:hypothetical protein
MYKKKCKHENHKNNGNIKPKKLLKIFIQYNDINEITSLTLGLTID